MMEKARREGMRWNLLNVLHKARPYDTNEKFLLDVMRGIYPDATALEVRQHLDYLAKSELVILDKQPHGIWYSRINAKGVDVVEYTSECQAGIARPDKYWE
ncbi:MULTISPECIES: hypothetical protein [Pasteurellaceae]|uniref:Uncharacterized protein n=1 Tax=Avibacterium avium TaxID=751 RepID=A0A379AQD7_AVIAV|nr:MULTISPECIES: hypothetical protein [Pasteurellaceae]KGQ48578.1 hypothetical protein JL12_08935 [Gallibacterium anatis 10672-6]WIM82566.1 hypothetical protein QP019_02585 [Gallibacterium anatis]SUB23916.1 Uncharacterised protein [Avibacterium avium]